MITKKKTGLLEETADSRTGVVAGAGRVQGEPETSVPQTAPPRKKPPKTNKQTKKTETRLKGFTPSRS